MTAEPVSRCCGAPIKWKHGGDPELGGKYDNWMVCAKCGKPTSAADFTPAEQPVNPKMIECPECRQSIFHDCIKLAGTEEQPMSKSMKRRLEAQGAIPNETGSEGLEALAVEVVREWTKAEKPLTAIVLAALRRAVAAKGAIPEEQSTQKFFLRCTKCGDLRDVHIPMNEPGFAYSGKCSRCGGEVVLDNYQKPAEEQDKGGALEPALYTETEYSHVCGLHYQAHQENVTLHKLVGEMVGALEEAQDYLPDGVLNDLLARAKEIKS